MNIKIISIIRNFSYALALNIFSLVVSVLVVLIVPRLIGVEEYGYWQLYLFYSSYVGFLHFGWSDGIYLRYGGKDYKNLDKGMFFSQFYMLLMLQLLIAAIIFLISILAVLDVNKVFIFKMTALCLFIVNIRIMLIHIMQGTNRIKEYAQVVLIDKLLFICLVVIILISGVREFKLIIVVDLIGKSISLSYAMYCCRDIVFRNISTLYISLNETIININVGIKLMFANIASMLIIGVVRFGIERSWDVSTFGKVSLALSVSNLVMIFINAIGIILFPILRITNDKKLAIIYTDIRTFLMVILLGTLILYFPLKVLLSLWLPNYTDSLKYMALVFPMLVYEGKMALLINTYLKALRKESLMLKVNLISLSISIIVAFITTIVFNNLDLAILSIVFLLAFRCILAELPLCSTMEISIYKDTILELTLTFIFILFGWLVDPWLGVVVYAVAYAMYLIVKRKDINNAIKNARLLISD